MIRSTPYFEVLTTLIDLRGNFPTTEWYGFGSFFNREGSFSDIDILAICSDENEALGIRGALSELATAWPIHLIVMTENEEIETNFIVRQGCSLLVGAKTRECYSLLISD